MEKRKIHLNRLVLQIILGSFVLGSGLLLIMDVYLIINHQNQLANSYYDMFDEMIEQIEQAMTEVEDIVVEVSANNDGFRLLASATKDTVKLSSMYDLVTELDARLSVKENFHGYYICYPSQEKCRYSTDTSEITGANAKALYNIFSNLDELDAGDLWLTLDIDENFCLARAVSRNQVTLVGLYSLKEVLEEMQSGEEAELLLFDGETFLLGGESEKSAQIEQLCRTNHQKFEKMTADGFLCGTRLENTDLWIVAAYRRNIVQRMGGLACAISFIWVCFAAAMWRVRRFLRAELETPLREMEESMNAIRENGISPTEKKQYRIYELQKVNDTFDLLISEIAQQKIKVYEEMLEKQKAKRQYLQLQLKPHFYLNSLKTIYAMLCDRQYENAQEMIVQLSAHMRYMLTSDREWSALQEEIVFTDNYVKIQKELTGRKILYQCHAETGSESVPVPVLCIQGFVENSIKYAKLGEIERVLEITVTVRLLHSEEESYISITVQDNGSGYSEEVLRILNSREGYEEGNVHVGIRNIIRRCDYLYGGKAEFSFYNDEGAVSEMIFPVTLSEE